MTNPLGMHAGQYRNEYTEAENQSFTERFGSITAAMADAIVAWADANLD